MTTVAVAKLSLLDTNVIVYAVDQASAFHQISRELLLKAADEKHIVRFCITPQVVSEFFQ
jgi:predicted nucleic acid-binding protein